jgi:hypothetical protein
VPSCTGSGQENGTARRRGFLFGTANANSAPSGRRRRGGGSAGTKPGTGGAELSGRGVHATGYAGASAGMLWQPMTAICRVSGQRVEACGRSRRGCKRSTLIKAIWDGAVLEHHLAVRRAHSGTCSGLQVPRQGEATRRHGLRERRGEQSRAEAAQGRRCGRAMGRRRCGAARVRVAGG